MEVMVRNSAILHRLVVSGLATVVIIVGAARFGLAQELAEVSGSELAPAWRVRGEYLLWWSNGNPLPPLVTTSPAGTPRPSAGVLGQPGTEIVYGAQTIDTEFNPARVNGCMSTQDSMPYETIRGRSRPAGLHPSPDFAGGGQPADVGGER